MRGTQAWRLCLLLLAAALASAVIAWLRYSDEPAYHGRRLSTWIEDLNMPQQEAETFADVGLRRQKLTNVVEAVGAEALPSAMGWIRDKPRKTWYEDIQDRIESAFRGRVHLPDRKDHSGDAILVFQILGPKAKQAVPDLAKLALADPTCCEASYCLSVLGPEAVPALSNAVANGTPRARSAAIDGLAEIGPSAFSTAPLLCQMMQTNSQSTWRVLRALVEVETNAAALLPVMVQYLHDTNAPPGTHDFQAAAAYALARLGPQGVPALLEALSPALKPSSAQPPKPPCFRDSKT